jgi:DNA polymerase-3 subunit alpha
VKDQQPALAVTDLANAFALVRFYKAARGKGIKPIVGVDAWITNDDNRDKPFRLLLLARTIPATCSCANCCPRPG